MKKYCFSPIILTVILLTTFSSCGTGQKYVCPDLSRKENITPFQQGWCDENTYIISSGSFYDMKIKDVEKRKDKALKEALRIAKLQIYNSVEDSCRTDYCGCLTENKEKEALEKKFYGKLKKVIESGEPIYTEYQLDGCIIIYRITDPGLEKFIKGCVQ